MNKLQAGFSRVDVTPPLGIAINGYFVPRNAEKILDALEVNCVALGCGQEKVLLMSVDNLGIAQKLLLPMRQAIREATGLPLEAIYVHATHSHTAGAITPMLENEENLEYREFVQAKLVEAALLALADLQPARMGWGMGQAPKVAFVRRFRMKDGSVRTNPGTNHPDIVAPIGEVDERVNVLRFDRETDSLVLMNFGNHPDTVGGCNISADWPGFARRSLEQAIPGTKAIMFNGAQGDVNHINVHPTGGDGNDLTRDFDDVDRGYGHARHIGRVIAGAVLQVYDKVCYTDVEQLRYIQNTVNIPSNMPEAKDLPLARKYADLHNNGKDAEIPYTGMMLTTVVAEALRMLRLENGPESFQLPMSGIAIGNVAMIGIAGEPFTGIGRALKEAPGWDLVLPTCATNGYEGYFPMMDSYVEGGYEARSSNFKAGVAELLITEGQKLLAQLRK
jgi:hypothetical protein